ncbi:acyl carrier protein [Streptomyces asiaticus]|uniref:acyl carrier protein n=1 Tax=Streptomyces asiaticus TaxID=114695 RepID=UPI003400860F
MTDSSRYEIWLTERLSALSSPPRPAADLSLGAHLRDDLGVDSLAFIELMVGFEQQFDLRLDEGDLLPSRYSTVGDVLAEVKKYVSGPRTA